jgi:hypothetical protein
VGITRPTVLFLAPRFSIFSIMRGSTVSEDEVPSTTSSSSLMYLMNFQIEKPWKRAINPSTTKMKIRQVA